MRLDMPQSHGPAPHSRVKLHTLEVLNPLNIVESQVEILQLLQPTNVLCKTRERLLSFRNSMQHGKIGLIPKLHTAWKISLTNFGNKVVL